MPDSIESTSSVNLAQEAWDRCEAIDDKLAYLNGLDRPLYDLLDEGLISSAPRVSAGVYALLEAKRLFRMQIARETAALRSRVRG